MGEFITEHRQKKGPLFGGVNCAPRPDRHEIATRILPTLRGVLSSNRLVIAHYCDEEDVLRFAGGKWARELAALGTSCPDHFLRTKIRPLFVDWDATRGDLDDLKVRIEEQAAAYRTEYKNYYE